MTPDQRKAATELARLRLLRLGAGVQQCGNGRFVIAIGSARYRASSPTTLAALATFLEGRARG